MSVTWRTIIFKLELSVCLNVLIPILKLDLVRKCSCFQNEKDLSFWVFYHFDAQFKNIENHEIRIVVWGAIKKL